MKIDSTIPSMKILKNILEFYQNGDTNELFKTLESATEFYDEFVHGVDNDNRIASVDIILKDGVLYISNYAIPSMDEQDKFDDSLHITRMLAGAVENKLQNRESEFQNN